MKFLILLLVFSCSRTQVRNVDYEGNHLYSRELSKKIKYEDIGLVNASESTFAWEPCRNIALAAVADIVEQTKLKGGNAIVDVTWSIGEEEADYPSCTNRWGWWFAYVVGGLGPWMKNVEVSGIAAKIEIPTTTPIPQTFIFDPKKSSMEIAQEIVKNFQKRILYFPRDTF